MFVKKAGYKCGKVLLVIFILLSSSSVIAQTNITGMAGYTTVNNAGGVYNITSSKTLNNGDAILNRFSSFQLGNGNTANILLGNALGIAKTAINVVHDATGTPTAINGVVKLLSGYNGAAPVGGNLIFVDPNGFMVGANGQINAGSILLSASDRTFISLNGGSTQVNINSTAQDALLDTSVVDINGIYRFNSITGIANIEGTLNTLNGNAPAGIKPGVNIFASQITLANTATVFTKSNSAVNLITGKNISYNVSSGDASVSLPLDNSGSIEIAGRISSPDGEVIAWANSLDLLNNMLNLTGIIDASSLSGSTNGSVVLRSGMSTNSYGEVQINNGMIDSSGDIELNTGSALNINGAGSQLDAGKSVVITANGMYLEGDYQANTGNVTITNTGGNPLLVDANLTANAGDVNITSDGTVVLDFAESQLPAGTLPLTDQQTYAENNVYIGADNFTSYGIITAHNGEVTVASNTDAAFVGHCGINSFNTISVLANTILVNQPFNTIDGDINLITNTGDVFLGANGMLSSLNSAINIFRAFASGKLIFTAEGIISADQVENGLVVGNAPCSAENSSPVDLAGSTFGSYANTYTRPTTVAPNPLLVNDLYVNNFKVGIFGSGPDPDPPNPHNPDQSQFWSNKTGTSSGNSDQVLVIRI